MYLIEVETETKKPYIVLDYFTASYHIQIDFYFYCCRRSIRQCRCASEVS